MRRLRIQWTGMIHRHVLRLVYGMALLSALCVGPPAHVVRADAVISICDEAHLRSAIAAGGTITFGCSGTITVTSQITFSNDVTLDGAGQKVEIDGGGPKSNYSIFSFTSIPGAFTVRNLTFANANSDYASQTSGSAISSYPYGTLTVIGCTFTNNTNGAIDAYGDLTVINSTFTNNSGYNNGAISTSRNATLINDTITGNSSSFGSGGILADNQVNISNTILYNNNSANSDGGNFYWGGGGGGVFTDDGYNLLGAGSVHGATFNNPTDISGNPSLAALADNGGSTKTMALSTGSPALNVIPGASYCNSGMAPLLYDQRGVTRPQPAGGKCDIGAYESGPLITVSATSLPTGTVGVAYGPIAFSATGGSGGYTFSLSGGPAGLSVTGSSLRGTPTQAGNFTLLITATDSLSNAGSRLYPLTINPAATTTTASNSTTLDSQDFTLTALVTSPGATVNEGTVYFALYQNGNGFTSATSPTVSNGNASVTFQNGLPPGSYTIEATYNPGPDYTGSSDTSHTLTSTLGPVTHFSVTGYPSFTNAGESHAFTVTALDAANVTVAGYGGTVHFSSSDPQAVFSNNDVTLSGGSGTFTAILITAGPQNITATDRGNGSISGSRGTTVAPTLTAISPNIGLVTGGTRVTLTGTSFATGAVVQIGGVDATNVVVVNSTTITATTPAHAAGTVDAVVFVGGVAAVLSQSYTYMSTLPNPTLTGISPASGPVSGGTPVTLTGTAFAAGATVSIGSVACTNVRVVNSTTLTCTTGAHVAGTVDVVMQTNGTTLAIIGGFTYGTVNPAPGTRSGPPSGQTRPDSIPAARSGAPSGGSTPEPIPGGRP